MNTTRAHIQLTSAHSTESKCCKQQLAYCDIDRTVTCNGNCTLLVSEISLLSARVAVNCATA